jgi:tRNA-dihydrouridine synthase
VACSQSEEYPKIPIIGNGDIFSYTDYEEKVAREGVNTTAMLARGAVCLRFETFVILILCCCLFYDPS